MKKVMLIINPTSGGEKALDFKDKLDQKLQEHFDEVEIKITEKEFDATEFAREACKNKFDTIVAFGGDGTVNEVIAGMAEQEFIPKLSIIPGGTVNLMSRLLGIDQNIEIAIDELDFNNIERVDIGKCNDKYFGYILSIGSVPEAIHNVGIEEKTKFGFFAYLGNVLKTVINDTTFSINIKTEYREYKGKANQVMIMLSNLLGDTKIFEGDKDGYANILILKDSSLGSKLSLIPDLLAGNIIENEEVEYIRAKNIEITSDENLETDIDGDKGDRLPVKITVLPQHVEVYSKKR